jgi:CHAT domain-containing protein/predicted negative regulator of RcsB-dependent stress response
MREYISNLSWRLFNRAAVRPYRSAKEGEQSVLTVTWRHRIQAAWQPDAGRWTVSVWPVLLGVVVCGLCALSPLWHASQAWGARPTGSADRSASQHMAAGLEAFRRGDIGAAAKAWQEAARLYAEAKQPKAHRVALTHLARAYAALGHYGQAEHSLRTVLKLAGQAGDRAQVASVLATLGDIAVATGDLLEADRLLGDALAQARELGDAGIVASVLHTRGNLFMAQQQPHEALAAYRDSAASAQQAHQVGLAARALAHAALAAERDGQPQASKALLDDALAHLRRAEPSHDTAYDALLIGRTYHRLAQADPPLVLRAAEVFTEASDLAQRLEDARALSYAWGYLGRLYEEEGRHQEALQLTRRAALAAQQVHSPESLYLWQWQTGRLLRALGDIQSAIAAYERAVATVQSMRPELLGGYGGAAIVFRTSLGPLYLELTDLYLRQAAALEARRQEVMDPQYERYLQQARATVEQFKTAELREYFGDECVDAARPSTTALERVAPDTVIVYPILLPDRTELLVSLPTGLKRIERHVAGPQLEQRTTVFRNALEERDPLRYLQHAQYLYTWLIQPLEADLAARHIQTLVFVPDGALRLLPWAALHDGRQFLIEKYAVAITPSLTLTDPRPLPRDKGPILAAGMTGAVEGFPPLPRVREELRGIQQLYAGVLLLDHDFGPESLDRTLRQGQFDIVHIASHGHFAPDSAQSYLLTAQGRLTMERFSQIVGRLRFREQPLELLALSACETARGDDRAALGLAGVAIQAGARSALATLWLVADDAAAVLMQEF